MNNIFDFAERCLFDSDVDAKLALTHQAWSLLEVGGLSMMSSAAPRPISDTVFPEQPVLLAPRDMPRRRLESPAGKMAFFHALAHIEFMAMYLAWDIVYRFRGLPEAFYRDWLRIAEEEALHFALLRGHLRGLNARLRGFAGPWRIVVARGGHSRRYSGKTGDSAALHGSAGTGCDAGDDRQS